MNLAGRLLLMLALAGCAGQVPAPVAVSEAATPAGAGLVDIRTLVPDIDLDIRYAGSNNFVGRPVDGYGAPKCLLLKPAAEALAQVERNVRARGQRLRIFDCYRPRRAVLDFMRWVQDARDVGTKAAFYPNLDKQALLGEYISPTSGHSRAGTVDLTLLACDAGGQCTPLDMGTSFDLFDTLANTDAPQASDAQRRNRHALRDAMQAQGFMNYPMEWWHYTLTPEPSPDVAFDVPLQ